MPRYDSLRAPIVQKRQLTNDVFDLTLSAPVLAAEAVPGQFAHVRLPGRTLRRPISLCAIDRAAGTLRLVFQVRGEGTRELAEFEAGDTLEVLAPLGKGFPTDLPGRVLLLGGGIGVPPLLGVAACYGENALAALGFRSREAVILEEDFRMTGAKTMIATDDGSYGQHGLVTGLCREEEFSAVLACGPGPMLRAAKALSEKRGVPCFLSLEERMACGVGACLGCAVALLGEDGQTHYGRVCKDGPVFPGEQVVF